MSTSTAPKKTKPVRTRHPAKKPSRPPAKKPSRPFGMLSSEEFSDKKWPLKWLAEGIFVARQPGVIGGPLKSLKTSLTLDLAISLGSRRPFLGKFRVPRTRRVAMFSGETVRGSLQANARRICNSKGVSLEETGVLWGFTVPRLSVDSDRRQLRQLIKDEGIEVVFIDPLYLSLGASGGSLTNLFETGPMLRDFAATCLDAGATPFFLHHSTKTSAQRRQASASKSESDEEKAKLIRADLGDLAYAGIGEFARQWLLISRRSQFDPDTGSNELSLTVGGSAGQAGNWNVDVEEGVMSPDFGGRKWQVEFPSAKPTTYGMGTGLNFDDEC